MLRLLDVLSLTWYSFMRLNGFIVVVVLGSSIHKDYPALRPALRPARLELAQAIKRRCARLTRGSATQDIYIDINYREFLKHVFATLYNPKDLDEAGG